MFKVLIKGENISNGPEYIPLDLDDDGGIILTANEPLQFQYGLSFKTYNINIFNTPHNNSLLKNLFNKNYNRIVEFNDVYLVIDNIYFKSVLYIKSFNSKSAKGQLVSSAGYIWHELKNKNLITDFDWSQYEHILNMANVSATNLFGGDIKYDFIYRGQGVYGGELMKNVDICERRPSIKLDAILRNIFKGYNIVQNVWDPNIYDNIYLTPTGQDLLVPDDWYENSYIYNFVSGEKGFGNTNLTESTGINYYYFREWWNEIEGADITYDGNLIKYVASETSSYRFSGRLKGSYTISSNTSGYWRNREIFVNIIKTKLDLSTETYTYNLNTLSNLYTSFIDESFDINIDTKLIYLEKGEYITILVSYSNREFDGSNDPIVPPQNQTILGEYDDDSYIKVEPFNHKGYNSLVEAADILPNMKVDDFMIALLTNYNVEFYYNFETSTIYLQNRYVYKPPVYDITDLIIEDTYDVDLKRPPVNYLFSYTNDSNDFFYKIGVEQQFRDGGNKLIDNEKDSEIREVKNAFSFNMMRVREPKIIAMHNEDDTYSTQFNPRLMFYAGEKNWNYTLHSAGMLNPQTFNRNTIPHFTNSLSGETLSFNNTENEIGIYDKYFNQNIERLLDGSVIELDLFIDELFLSNLYYLNGRDLRAVFYINTYGIQGFYQMVKMDRKDKYIYRCKLFRDANFKWDLPTPPSELGDFNNDFGNDFSI